MNADTADEKVYITLARIGRPRGVRGEFYIQPLADDYGRFSRLKTVYLAQRRRRITTEAESFKVVSGKAVFKVRQINSPEEAQVWVIKKIEGAQ